MMYSVNQEFFQTRVNRIGKGIGLIICLIVLQFSGFMLAKDVLNPDKPLKGKWDFRLKKVWEIEKLGKKPLAHPQQILITKEGKIVVADRALECIYVLNKKGKKLFTFACKGVGRGKVTGVTRIFGQEELIVIDGKNINYFSPKGKFTRAYSRKSYFFSPRLFVNDSIFIGAPFSKIEIKRGRGKIMLVDLNRKRKKTIGQFHLSPYGIVQQGKKEYGIYDEAFTPTMVIGHHQGRLFYGLNDSYTISVGDMSGNKIFSFGIKRKDRTTTADQMRQRLKKAGIPTLIFADLLHQLPKKITHFNRIEIHSGYIYVFITPLKLYPRERFIDIFSLAGEYLYKAKIVLPEGNQMMATIFSNLVIKNNDILVAYRKDKGKVIIGKYNIKLPRD